MCRRIAVAVLAPPHWSPPGVDPLDWRLALADDLLDVLATLVDVDPAIAVAAGDPLPLDRVGWPGLCGYRPSTLDVAEVLAAATADGYDQAVLLAGDVPDLPGLLIAALLRPLTTRPVAAAAAAASPPTAPTPEATTGPPGPPAPPVSPVLPDQPVSPASRGLFGLAAHLPAPDWLPHATLDALTVQALRRVAPHPAEVAATAGWHRLRGPADLELLDPRLPGWDATRALLERSASANP